MIREGQAKCNHKHKAGPYITVFIISTLTAEKGRTKIKREGGREGGRKGKRDEMEMFCGEVKMPTMFKSLSSISFYPKDDRD